MNEHIGKQAYLINEAHTPKNKLLIVGMYDNKRLHCQYIEQSDLYRACFLEELTILK